MLEMLGLVISLDSEEHYFYFAAKFIGEVFDVRRSTYRMECGRIIKPEKCEDVVRDFGHFDCFSA